MIESVLRAKIVEYAPGNALDQENVLHELLQYFVLASLARSGLFATAMFHGGTCLRVIHSTSRFSEDLDFLLKERDASFRWQPYLEHVRSDLSSEGMDLEVQDRSAAEVAVQKAFLKTDSIGKVLELSLPFERRLEKKVRIKLEIDTNPPAGSQYCTSYITFPVPAALTIQALPSGFALRLHAVLCRNYCKGRDWFDFIWYVGRRVVPDLALLANALAQQGPWASCAPAVTADWLVRQLRAAIQQIDWAAARDDVQRFLPQREQPGLSVWGAAFFLSQLDRLAELLEAARAPK